MAGAGTARGAPQPAHYVAGPLVVLGSAASFCADLEVVDAPLGRAEEAHRVDAEDGGAQDALRVRVPQPRYLVCPHPAKGRRLADARSRNRSSKRAGSRPAQN
jgi:hypothetical protein